MKKVKKFGGMRKHIIIVLCLVLFLLVNNSSLAGLPENPPEITVTIDLPWYQILSPESLVYKYDRSSNTWKFRFLSARAEFNPVQEMVFDDYLKDHYELIGKNLDGNNELYGYRLFRSISIAEVSGYGQITVTGPEEIGLSESAAAEAPPEAPCDINKQSCPDASSSVLPSFMRGSTVIASPAELSIPASGYSCTTPTCDEIDNVWSQIRGYLSSLESAKKSQIWDQGWKEPRVAVASTGTPTVPRVPTNLLNIPGVQTDLNAKKYNSDFIAKVEQISNQLTINPIHLMAIMDFETGHTFSPSQLNLAGSGAVGLIQFTESTAVSLGTNSFALSQMSQLEQLNYVKKYLQRYTGIRPNNFGDVAMAVFYPKGIGKNDNDILIKSDAGAAYNLNNGLDKNSDGISRGEYLAAAMPSLRKYSE